MRTPTSIRLRRLRSLSLSAVLVSCAVFTGTADATGPSTLIRWPESAIQEYAIPGEATSIAVGPEEDIWFTTRSGQIDRINADGLLTGQFSVPTGVGPDVPEGSAIPANLVLGGDGNMWFIDWGENHSGEKLIGRISPAGHVTEFPVNFGKPGGITGLVRGEHGDMWYSGFTGVEENIPSAAYLVRVDREGQATRFEVPEGIGEGGGVPFDGVPESLTLGPDGDIWFIGGRDVKGRAIIERMTPNGVVMSMPVSGSAFARGLVLGSDGDMWFAAGSAVERMAPSGTIVSSTGLEDQFCVSLVPDLEGNVWCAEENGYGEKQNLARISASGEITHFAETRIEYGALPARGVGNALWYPGYGERLVRLLIPERPVILESPAISGGLHTGERLTTSNGSWTGEPESFRYQWELCDSFGANCQALAAGTAQSLELTPDQVGHTLRAIVTATGAGGSASATAEASGVVVAPARNETKTSVEIANVRRAPRPPIVASSMTWRFGWAPRYTIVDALVVHNLPTNAWIDIACSGRGCPFMHRRLYVRKGRPSARCRGCRRKRSPSGTGELDIARLFHRCHLGPRTRIVVTVDAKGATGKEFTFTVRANRPPRIKIGAS